MSNLLDKIQVLAEKAKLWRGWEWPQDVACGQVTEGPGYLGSLEDWAAWEKDRASWWLGEDDIHGQPLDAEAAAEAAAAEADYGYDAQVSAQECSELAAEIILAVSRDNLYEALKLAEKACRIERTYGDCPSYGPLYEALEQAIDELETKKYALTASGTNSLGNEIELFGDSLEELTQELLNYGDPYLKAAVYDVSGFLKGWLSGDGSWREP